MGVNHPGLQLSMDELIRIVRREAVATIQNASIGRAGLRVYDGGSITIQGGGLFVTGTESVSGLLSVTGRLLGSGELVWSGPWELSGAGDITGPVDIDGNLAINGTSKFTGPMTVLGTSKFDGAWDFVGNGKIRGNVDISGALDVLSRFTLGPSGYIQVGPIRIDRAGSYGGRIASTGTLDLIGESRVRLGPFGATLIGGSQVIGSLDVVGNFDASGSKNFKIPHPTKVDHHLRHGATESPHSGVEYWGEETLSDAGTATVELPDYFEALTSPENRAVLVTPRGFVADWGDIEDGKFTVTGKPGGRFSWLAKAVRKDEHGGRFELEEPVFGPLREERS